MANIQNYLNQIKTAVFGKDVRESIHDAIKQCYDDATVNHDNANMEVKLARGSHNTLNDRLDENEKKQENLSSQLVTKASKDDVARISSGTPLFASTTTEMTDVTKNYVNTTDGYLYVYSGGSWNKTTVQYQATGLSDGQVTKDKLDLSLNQKITNGLEYLTNSLINWDGTIATQNADPYNRHKILKYYPINSNQIIKFKNNSTGAYDTAFKYLFYDINKTFIGGSGVLIRDIPSLTVNSSPVSYDGVNITINMSEVLAKYSNAKYVCITFLKDEVVELYDISRAKIEWLDLNGNKEYENLKNSINNKQFEKPFVIFSFDWYSRMYDKRYKILKGEYGYNATFCLDSQTPNYELDATLTRTQFNEMIENGWDYAFYGGIGERGSTEESWTNYIKGIINQKENIGIFNPVMYNTPDNNSADYISRAVKNNGFKMQRCNTSDNLLKSPSQFQTGAVFMCTGFKQNCKNMIDNAIANNCGVVFYTHLVIDDSSDINDGADGSAGHCYESSFREILNYLKTKVDNGEIEVLTASEYYNKYNNIDSVKYDKNRETKRFNYLCSKVMI